ncbi:hypothetical protein N0V82_006424 [Gnomoniopsis sp. IMI 355080]|nr:hypothetical protein N0V82_006424 [Gnomoniopsis sp. IMI 355080]
MEVHLQGLAEFLTNDALKTRLEPLMDRLGIPSHAFTCEKYPKRKWANVTFLQHSQGQAFLQKHGTQQLPVQSHQGGRRLSTVSSTHGSVDGSVYGSLQSSVPNGSRNGYNRSAARLPGKNSGPRRKARLTLAGNEVFCDLSKPHDGNSAAGQPDPITLRGLQYAAEEKIKPTRKVQKEANPNVFDVESFSCGYNAFDGDRLVFVPEAEFQNSSGTAKFTKKTLLIKLRSGFVIRISVDTIVDLICSFNRILTLTLTEVPSFFRESSPSSLEITSLLRSMGLGDADPTLNSDSRVRTDRLNEQHAHVVGQCLVYQLHVTGTDLPRRMQALEEHGAVPFQHFNLVTQRTPPPPLGNFRSKMDALMAELAISLQGNDLPFGILAQLQALAWNAYLHPGIVLELMRELRRDFKLNRDAGKRPISVGALKMLFKQIDWPTPHGESSHFKVKPIIVLLRENNRKVQEETILQQEVLAPNQNLVSIHRVTVTPSRITLHGPELEAKNRILRKYPNHHEYFVRVQFCDENGQDINIFNPKINQDEVWMRFKHIMGSGIQIAGRTFSFLGFSHSSLRSHSAWFSAPFIDDGGNLQTYFSIIRALGTFSDIRSPAKCAARIGQAFSETPFSLSLDEHSIVVVNIPDVTSADGTRVFSDGVGTLSWEAVHHIWDVVPATKAAPTAFQIRFRGSKGMLAVDSTLEGSEVRLRPSMTKFNSQDEAVLEICDMASKPIPLVLNRQMIKILEDMGVASKWFLDMQNIELKRLREVTADPYSVADFLGHKKVGEGIRAHRLFRQAANMNIDWRKDPFLRSIVEAMVLRDLRLLKHKARIPISEGITLFGVMDETGFLQENEVYVTYDFSSSQNRFEPPPSASGLIVTRSPALHPGDIQFPRNVIPPAGHPLRDLTNVIVFSQRGSRDLPSQLSGGDLDGDIYNVIWDPRAVPQRVFRPADYPRVDALDLERPVTKEDMASFFIDFIKQDCLGVIATRHMILADQKEDGTLNTDCLQLAQLHSTAVDFSKSGKGEQLNQLPKSNRFRPDFFAPGPETRMVDRSEIDLDEYIVESAADEEEDQFSSMRYQYYKSEKILGQLYRAVDVPKIWKEHVQSKFRPVGALFWDEFLLKIRPRYEAVVGSTAAMANHMETAREIRGWYGTAMTDAMRQYSEHPIKPITELEVFIGNILNRSGVQTNRQRDKSIKLKDEFERISNWITKMMRRVSHNPEVPPTGYQSQHDNLHLCFACVYVGGEVVKGDVWHSDYNGLQSFRVVAACALLSELATFEVGRGGGGYVRVRGTGNTTIRTGTGPYAAVPPPAGGF